jgi:Flp pilus assembly protein TadD
MGTQRAWLMLAAAGLALGACTSKAEETPATSPATAPAQGAETAPAATDASKKSSDTEPVSLNWKDERKAKALAGIVYSSGRAVIDPTAAATKVTVRDAALAAEMHARGTQELAQNLVIEAIDTFTRAVLLEPENAEHYSGLASALLAKRMAKEAVAALRVAVELAPSSAKLRFELGDALVRVNAREEAVVELEKSLALDATNAVAHERLAVQLYYANDFARAWSEVHACEASGGAVAPQFRDLLARAALEPAK